MGVTSLLSSPPDIINNSVGNPPSGGNSQSKKSSSRRNAWGNLSYADLITQAIKNSPDQRLTLSQVYEWMVANIPYFKDKGDSNSSAGWKVRKHFEEIVYHLGNNGIGWKFWNKRLHNSKCKIVFYKSFFAFEPWQQKNSLLNYWFVLAIVWTLLMSSWRLWG